MSQEFVTSLTVLLPSILLTLTLAGCDVVDPFSDWQHRKILLTICALVLCLIAQDYLSYILETSVVNPFARTIVSIVGYSLRPAILALFCFLVHPGRHVRLIWGLIGLNTAVYLTALFSPLTFSISAANRYQSGPLRHFCLVVSVLLLLYLLVLTFSEFRTQGRHSLFIPFLTTLMIAMGILLDYHVGKSLQILSFLTVSIVLGSNAFYFWLHLRFARLHEKELKDGQRFQIMLSQIKPHFFINTLEAIRRLCTVEPQKAEAAILTFERYLRGNMDSLTQDGLIPFQTELEHTRFYLELEQLRFPDELHIMYDLTCTDFCLPPLTLQPMAENAVCHGVRGKKSGEGTVTIMTREYPDRYELTVADDGPGFDPEALPEDGRPHIGLANVRERLRRVGAELRIACGAVGGTLATITVPKSGENGGS